MRRGALATALVMAVLAAMSVGSGTAWSNDDPPGLGATTTTAPPSTSTTVTTTSPSTTSTTTPATAPPNTESPPTTAPSTTVPPPTAAPAGTTVVPKARGVGDSVFLSAQNEVMARLRPEYAPWFEAALGASINEMQDEAEQMVTKNPAVFVIAMGNPDVENMDSDLGRYVVYGWANDMLEATASVPCVVWMGLKQGGVNPYYSPTWKRDATAFNNWLRSRMSAYPNFHVADWNTAAQAHPGWFLEDGLHLNQSGQNGYATKIDRVVSRVCATG